MASASRRAPRRRRSEPEVLGKRGGLTVERDPLRPSGRLLRHAGMDSSYVDLADPRHLEFDYLRWMRVLLTASRARRVLHLGGGGCALARALAAEDPGGLQQVCEVDPDVLAVARDHLGLRHAPGLRVRQIDGLEFVRRQPPGGWDAVVLDAYVGAAIPARLIETEAFRRYRAVAPLVLVNVVDDRTRRVLAAVAGACGAAGFAGVWTLGARVGNAVVIGCETSMDVRRVAPELAADPSPAALRRSFPPSRHG